MIKKGLLYLLLITVLLVVLPFSFHAIQSQHHLPVIRPIASINTVSVAIFSPVKIFDHIEAIGTAKASEAVTISVNVTEYVEKIYFEDGAYVKKGDLLATLQSAQERAQLKEAQARLAQMKRYHDRVLQLAGKNYLAKSDFDASESNFKSAEAKVDEIEAKINDRTIRAPFSGVLGFRQVSYGTLLEPGQEIVKLDAINPLKVDFNLPEKLLSLVKIGQQVQARSIAFPQEVFTGNIKAIAARIDAKTRTILVRAVIDNPKHLLRPGMLLRINIKEIPREAMLIPEQALVAVNEHRYVFIVNDNNTVSRKEVKVLGRHQNQVEIRGMPANSKIVVDGGFKLVPGQKVKINYADF